MDHDRTRGVRRTQRSHSQRTSTPISSTIKTIRNGGRRICYSNRRSPQSRRRRWKTYLLGSPHEIIIYTDHSNLQYWKEPRKINRQVAREFRELSEYNFILQHIPG